jgi:hypothetical protein
MGFKRSSISQWLNPLILLAIIVTSALTMIFVNQIDRIINIQLYKYGLQFNTSWANQYWTYATIIYTILSLIIVLSALSLILGLKVSKKEKAVNQKQTQPKQTIFIQQPKHQPVPAQPIVNQEQKPKESINKLESKEKVKNTVLSCPNCKKVLTTPLVMLNFEGGKPRLVNMCPYCNYTLGNAEDENTIKKDT